MRVLLAILAVLVALGTFPARSAPWSAAGSVARIERSSEITRVQSRSADMERILVQRAKRAERRGDIRTARRLYEQLSRLRKANSPRRRNRSSDGGSSGGRFSGGSSAGGGGSGGSGSGGSGSGGGGSSGGSGGGDDHDDDDDDDD